MKRLISALLVICLLVTVALAVPFTASAQNTAVIAVGDEQEYNGFLYTILSDGNAMITGYNGSQTSITLPSSINGHTVTSIGSYSAFADQVTSITIPDTVTTIESSAFEDLTNLSAIVIPDSVTTIGMNAFVGTAWFDSQPDGVVYAGRIACDFIGEVPEILSIKEGTVSICDYAFDSLSDIKSLSLPNTLKTIGWCAFEHCEDLTEITIPDSVTSIGNAAFLGCTALSKVTLSNSVTAIASATFYGCNSLTTISIPKSVTRIDAEAFSACIALAEINIPDSVISIGGGAFNGTAWYNSQPEGVVYAGKVAYTYKGVCPDAVALKEGTVGITDRAFVYCSNLTRLYIPASVTSIGYQSAGYIYYGSYSIYKNPSFSIHSYKGTAAESYASEASLAFVSLGDISETPKRTITLYFSNNKKWSSVCAYAWGGSAAMEWPGLVLDKVGVNKLGEDIYAAVLPYDITSVIFTNGSGMEQTEDITGNLIDGSGFYLETADAETGKWSVGYYEYAPAAPVDGPLLGDADGNGEITILDATMIQRYLAAFSVENPETVVKCGDVNGDGLDIVDATLIRRYLTNYTVPYPIGDLIESAEA